MNLFTTANKIIVTCPKRLAPYIEKEILELGMKPIRTFMTGVELKGTVNDCIRLNLNLRCASQVLYSLKAFTANQPDDLYKELVRYPWEKLIAEDGYFSVTSTVDHFTVNNNMFVSLRVKDAIADHMINDTGRRPDSGPNGDKAVFHLFWKDENAELFLDTSGETLTKHGYRKIPGKAPMLESLAAATIMATKWDRKSPFVNPMCGSGTVAIEAILAATNRRPGLYRNNYSFMHILGYDKKVYEEESKKLEEQVVEVPGLKAIVSDINEDAVNISRTNAAQAGVEDYIEFQHCDFAETHLPDKPGVVYFNPEYGVRLGDEKELEATYARIGDFMKNQCQGYLGYIFTGGLDLAKKIRLKPSRRIEFYTARIDCRLLEYELYGGTRRKFDNEPIG